MAGGRDLTRPKQPGSMPAGMPNPGDQIRDDPPAGPVVGGGRRQGSHHHQPTPRPDKASYDEHRPDSADYDEQQNEEQEHAAQDRSAIPGDQAHQDKQRQSLAPDGDELPVREHQHPPPSVRRPKATASAFSRCLMAIVFGAVVGAAIAGIGEWNLYPAAAITAIFAVIAGLVYGAWLSSRHQQEH
jgi:hypothetical protein